MRLSVLAIGAAVLAAMGCKPSAEEIRREQESREASFRNVLTRRFNRMNLDSHARKDDLRRALNVVSESPSLPPPTGTSFSTYTFDDQGFVAASYKCKTCGVKIAVGVITVAESAETPDIRRPVVLEYVCRSCGHSPYRMHLPGEDLRKSPCATCWKTAKMEEPTDLAKMSIEDLKKWFTDSGATVKLMFELVENDIDKPFKANVRYIRRGWSFDARGTVAVSPKAIERAAVNAAYIPSDVVSEEGGSAEFSRPGFHRVDLSFVGEMVFTFKGGDLNVAEREREEAIRPWKDLKVVR